MNNTGSHTGSQPVKTIDDGEEYVLSFEPLIPSSLEPNADLFCLLGHQSFRGSFFFSFGRKTTFLSFQITIVAQSRSKKVFIFNEISQFYRMQSRRGVVLLSEATVNFDDTEMIIIF